MKACFASTVHVLMASIHITVSASRDILADSARMRSTNVRVIRVNTVERATTSSMGSSVVAHLVPLVSYDCDLFCYLF